MKNILIISILLCVLSCEKDKTIQDEKKKFSDTEVLIKRYRADSQKYWDKNDSENALKYSDSINVLVINSFIDDYSFVTVDSIIYKTSNNKKPLFLQVTASWCAPCKAEIPALNKIVEKYKEKVDFVLLFWDTQSELKEFAEDYNNNVVLVPSQKKQSEATTIDISGFRHITGFPTNYLITSNKEIINYTSVTMVPGTFPKRDGGEITITQEDADKGNFERLEKEIKDLLKQENNLKN
ncbi:TlpA family protein disulfide reductase [Lacinutrix algicola]|uniref:TlpA family protein disulfide reductase n=1 Tax=Lacinutrix algicola TaxID=342954 RepID=UPI0006E2EF9B|nr:redoxin family protein [Lacinutrix algicola]